MRFSGRPGYSAAHYRRLANGGPDTPEQVQERIRYRAASEQAIAETREKFSPMTSENALEAIEWQAARIKELMR